MADLDERFEQARTLARQRREAPPHAQAGASIRRLDELEHAATQGPPRDREAAMKAFIELVGDLGQQDG
jgi:hypothetical protein